MKTLVTTLLLMLGMSSAQAFFCFNFSFSGGGGDRPRFGYYPPAAWFPAMTSPMPAGYGPGWKAAAPLQPVVAVEKEYDFQQYEGWRFRPLQEVNDAYGK